LNVHEGLLCAPASLAVYAEPYEGPHGIGVRIGYNASALKAGMTVSNEPGFYADGRFGIRIESIVLVRDAKTPNNFGEKGYLGFEHITMSVSRPCYALVSLTGVPRCPIHKNLIDIGLLTLDERKWLNDYHTEVWTKVSPLLQNDQRALHWLERECAPL
jgi:Xaa-Pro aminopeptidase